MARGIAVTGLILAAIAIAQDATGTGLIYWRWKPTFDRTYPFGPFVNRNHYATWAIVAVPLCIGYLIAHAAAHWHDRATPGVRGLSPRSTARAALLLAAAALMIVGVVLSLSRSGMLGLAAALGVGGWLSRARRREEGRRRGQPCRARGRPGGDRGDPDRR